MTIKVPGLRVTAVLPGAFCRETYQNMYLTRVTEHPE